MPILLNRITSKKQQLDHYWPIPPELVKNLDEWYRVELTYTSNAIEGNTLTRQETALVVEKGITGLLPFSQAGPGLARRYDQQQATTRLHAILSLRAQGLSLEEIELRLGTDSDQTEQAA